MQVKRSIIIYLLLSMRVDCRVTVKQQMLKLESSKHESKPELQQSKAASYMCRDFLASLDVESGQRRLEAVQLLQGLADVC